MSFLMVWVIVNTKHEQQRTFAQLKINWCIVSPPNVSSRVAISPKMITSINLEQYICFKKFLSACKHQLLISPKLLLDSFGDYLVILKEIRKTWRSHSFSAMKNGLGPYQISWCTFWKAYDLSNNLITHHVTDGCFKRKLWPLFYIIYV